MDKALKIKRNYSMWRAHQLLLEIENIVTIINDLDSAPRISSIINKAKSIFDKEQIRLNSQLEEDLTSGFNW